MSSNFFLSIRNLSMKISSSSVSPNIDNNSSRFSLYPLLPDVLPVRPVPVSEISDKLSVLAYDGLMFFVLQTSAKCTMCKPRCKGLSHFSRSQCRSQLTLFCQVALPQESTCILIGPYRNGFNRLKNSLLAYEAFFLLITFWF